MQRGLGALIQVAMARFQRLGELAMNHYGYVSEQLLPEWLSLPRLRRPRSAPNDGPPQRLDVQRVRSHFDFPGTGRVVTNNAAVLRKLKQLSPQGASGGRPDTPDRRTT